MEYIIEYFIDAKDSSITVSSVCDFRCFYPHYKR